MCESDQREVRDLELPRLMQAATARYAEAEREKRAKVMHAEGVLSLYLISGPTPREAALGDACRYV